MKSWPPNTFQDLKAVLWKDWPVHKGSNHPKSLKEKVDSLLHLACQDIKCVLVKDQILETYNIQLWLTLGEKYLRDQSLGLFTACISTLMITLKETGEWKQVFFNNTAQKIVDDFTFWDEM